ncbi:hypothetical protein ILUMI_22119 [Ignelater luminosus]|uniref:Endonuclease/exonuclease/phosphatase domain-containing protein n=1 Tax=Ignelater luminosus TaxID=2038154 RepID=A0A8K0G336_IGNLU|nr:hypothetical protein ILUMI_22119 [Ignelater luminosus]
MFSLKQTQWFSFRICNVNVCLLKSQLYNLEKVFSNGKLSLDNCFISVMRIKSSKLKKRSLHKIKLHIMAALTNSKNNKTILKAESSKKVQTKQCSSNSPANCVSGLRSKEEDIKTRHKESIRSFSDSSQNRSKTLSSNINKIPESRENIFSNIFMPSLNGNVNWRYNSMWSSAVNESRIMQNVSVRHPIVYRSFSDSRLQQQHLNLVYLNNAGTTTNHYNRYHMRRSNTPDSTNITAVAERDRQQAWTWRTWQHITYGKKFATKTSNKMSCNFTLMSYNVLAQELLTEHSYLYRGHHPKALLWEQRWTNLLAEIKQHNADILCLQEVQASHLENYYNELRKLGYDGLFKQRTGIRTDGCAIYYKSSLLNLVEYTTVEFNQSNIPVLNRDNVGIIVKFSPKQNPQNEFVVATTHLLYNPRREDVRLAQTQVLLSEVDRISFKKDGLNHSHLPIIITGDFNLTPNSAVYELITRGVLEYEHLTNRSLSKILANDTFVNATGKLLIPSSLRITDQCQHADLVEKRKENENLSREDELKVIQLQHSERILNGKCTKKASRSHFSTGTLSHHLALKSAYEHRHGDAVEATTFQDQWITVDYIFYSGVRDKHDLIREGKLKLISRYTIPTRHQLEGIRIPNFAFGSDHFSLVVKFQLDP